MEYIDYYITKDYDIEFTDWNDIRTVTDDGVLLQNFMLIAQEYLSPLVGDRITATKLSRVRSQVSAEYLQRPYVDSIQIREFTVEDSELSVTVVVNSNELSGATVLAPT